jgi:glycosyltransferase involved in cell wall biosynthesis
MRVLHVIPSITAAQGGLQSAVLNLCRAQQLCGMAPEIATLSEPGNPTDPAFADFTVHEFPCTFRPTGRSRAMGDWLAARAGDYAAVVAHSLWRDPLLYAASAPRLVVMAHGMLDPGALARRAWRKAWRRHLRLPGVLRKAVVVYTCQAELDRAQPGPGRFARASQVIALPVEVPDTPPPLPESGPVVALGRLHPRKGVQEWVRALRLLRERGVEFTALHAGPVEDAGYARRVRAEAGDVVEFLGPVDYARAQELLRTALVVCAPCNVAENFGMVIAEALAQGRPVVAGRKGLIVPALEAAGAVLGADATEDSLADAIGSLLANSPLRQQLAANGHRHAREHFAPQVIGQLWQALIRDLQPEHGTAAERKRTL